MAHVKALLTLNILLLLAILPIYDACSCLPSHEPVCGEDGVTYKNPCILFCLNWSRAAKGLQEIKEKCKGICECCDPQPCKCQKDYKPVCGEDNFTYNNYCTLDCKNIDRNCTGKREIKIKCLDTCENCPKQVGCGCSSIYDPVCGYDETTYYNQCHLDYNNKKRKNDGRAPIYVKCEKACEDCLPDDCSCGTTFDPVCGYDLNTYNSSCFLSCENKKLEKQNLPQIQICCNDSCDKCSECDSLICPLIYEPVCGSDGLNYNNECQFNNENKYRQVRNLPTLSLQCRRNCEECADESCRCSKISKPVCGSDKTTYKNKCLLDCENRKRFNKNLQAINIICNRDCAKCDEEKKICNCNLTVNPVCGSDNATYSNICQLDCENFQREENSLTQLNVICKRPCKECLEETCVCNKQYDPVCGSDKKNYSNLCMLDCENRKRHNNNYEIIKQICKGKCEECEELHCLCPENLEPVCGLDKKTYINECRLNCVNKGRKLKLLPQIEIKCKQACKDCPKPETCVCPIESSPVCGINNKTYSNLCILSCLNTYRTKRGLSSIKLRCEDKCEKCFQTNTCNCPEVYNPVCGSNWQTYENECILTCENENRSTRSLPPIHLCCNDKCKNCPNCKSCDCSERYQPICGSNGLNFENECTFNCENEYRRTHELPILTMNCKRSCSECKDEKCLPTELYSPVCGTDGKTYENESQLDCENKRRYNEKLAPIKIRCERTCRKCDEEEERCGCKNILSPICGSDNVIYNNFCHLDCENFYREDNNSTLVNVICNSPCDECDDEPCACIEEYDPICGSDGNTYINTCFLECYNKKRFEERSELVEIMCEGDCESCYEEVDRCSCDDNYEPVCGSDGNTYDNFCQLDCGNFLLEKEGFQLVELIHKGECLNN